MSKRFYKKPTAWAVLVMIIIIGWGLAFEARAKGYVALGHATFNYHESTGEIAWTPGKWALAAQLIGEGQYKESAVDTTKAFSASRFIHLPINKRRPYARLGVAYVDDHNPLVGNWNFRLGLGYEIGPLRIEAGHYSSAGVWDTNRGIDFVQISFTL